MITKFNSLWLEYKETQDEEIRQEMIQVIQAYVIENYADLSDEEQVIALKRDFESDLPKGVVAEALHVDRRLIRRFRYTHDRGVIDKQNHGTRQTIANSKRRKIMGRDDGECVRCSHPEDLSMHHVIPKKAGGLEAEQNLAMLCQDCHIEAHCGDYTTGRVAYDNIDEFWSEFAAEDNRGKA